MADFEDMVMIGLTCVTMAGLIVIAITVALSGIIGLKLRPRPRTIRLVGAAYMIAIACLVVGVPPELAFLEPLLAAPGALAAYWYWYGAFRQAWVEDPDRLPPGVHLANDDWRIGLLLLCAYLVMATARHYLYPYLFLPS